MELQVVLYVILLHLMGIYSMPLCGELCHVIGFYRSL